jgi:hypothetical protein
MGGRRIPAPGARDPETGFSIVVGDGAHAEILVVPTRPEVLPRGLAGDDVVRVTGEVGRVAPDRDAGRDLLGERGILDRYPGSPSIRATRIERLLEPSR